MVFLDNAATSYLKPPSVRRAVLEALTECASSGRGGYAATRAAEARVFKTRRALAQLYGLDRPEQVSFSFNATGALNMAIKGLANSGQIVISGFEHNAVARPVRAVCADGGFIVAKSPLFDPEAMLRAFDAAFTPGTTLAVCCHVSNVFGFIAPVEELDALCYARGVPLVIDASQSAGLVIPDTARLRATQFLCMPGHKGLYGPQGTGVALHLGSLPCATLIEGGTGSRSAELTQPEFEPDRFESGTLNIPGIAGLYEGVQFVQKRTPGRLLARERTLSLDAIAELQRMPGVRVFAPPEASLMTGVFSFTVEGWECEDIAGAFASAGIAVRAGLHCAPLAHQSAGSFPGGTVRVSPGAFTTPGDMEKLCRAVRTLSRKRSQV